MNENYDVNEGRPEWHESHVGPIIDKKTQTSSRLVRIIGGLVSKLTAPTRNRAGYAIDQFISMPTPESTPEEVEDFERKYIFGSSLKSIQNFPNNSPDSPSTPPEAA